ncbi:ABC transporter permease [Zhenhengia yiwuensis]|jgi:putative ABC transport system permease protein|uniref:ABC transporter permease n=1 Tax=Zhenhengia yiwuensis TaxID=2763666 RepID=A0A926EGF8_9FIRM|nr:ABC transporter permease [Zhenhengia yiwuensis]MBC8578037.1 ABC transporter permease [Zhenhengia yiwuensis]MBP3910123.1 ABC transporter permease [Niameybacter sp.]
MNLIECIKSAMNQLLGNKMRTFLTMLGMFIGIGSVIMVLGLGAGVKDLMMSTFDAIGKGTVMINVKDGRPENMLNQSDLEAIREMQEVEDAVFVGENWMTSIKDYKKEDKWIYFAGAPYNISIVQDVEITAGRMYAESEELAKANVCVVSDTYAKVILGSDTPSDAIGRMLELDIAGEKHEFEIVGIKKEMSFPGMPEEMMPLIAYIPFHTMDQITNFGDLRSYTGGFKVKEEYNPNEVAYQVSRLLDKRHNTQNGYQTQSASSMLDQMNTVMSVVTGFISFVAAISLVVGGIGIMNIMLVTVKERTREIGVRKAVGASNKEILRQFLVEAVILTLLGGIIGMLLGYVGAVALGNAFGITISLTSDMILFAVGTSSAIGIIFGVYPARQAAKLDPVEALRYE